MRSKGRNKVRRSGVVLAVLTSAGLVLAGCGLGGTAPEGTDETGGTEAGSIKPIEQLKDAPLKVGSKGFTEQLILGEMAVAVLEAAGAKPEDKTGISGTDAARKALTSGEIDMYWEYTGTTWVTHLGHDEKVDDAAKLAKQVANEDLAENNVKWLDYTELNNTYALAIRKEKGDELKITKASQLASLPEGELTFCVGREFATRPDGLRPMLQAYGIDPASVPSKDIHSMTDGLVYTETDKGSCNFGSVFTSDGRIAGLELTVLEDDKTFFPLYNAAMTIRKQTYDKYPELADVFNPVSAKLTTEVMQELNGQVDIDGKEPRAVARDWLRSEGFIG